MASSPPCGSDHGAVFALFSFFAADPDQRADDGAELHRLVLREVALLQALDVPVFVLAHDDQVDQAHDVVLAEAGELGPNRPLELGIVEADHEDLNRAK